MVPPAEFTSYYGRPILKPPVWKMPDVPAYLYFGGMAGASATMAALADATARPALRRVGRIAAAVGAAAGGGALVHDLGRPERFLNMLRVFKPTSPLSVGSWILASFGAASAAAAASEVTGRLPAIGRLAGAAAGALGPAMTTYTAVLLADTAAPSWHEAYRDLPFVFAGSAMASAGAVALMALPPEACGPPRRMAMLGSALEVVAATRLEHAYGLVSEPYRTGRPGAVLRASRVLAAAGAAATVAGRRSRALSVLAGVLLTGAAGAARYAIFSAGVASTEDPKYIVVPQRSRLDQQTLTRPDPPAYHP